MRFGPPTPLMSMLLKGAGKPGGGIPGDAYLTPNGLDYYRTPDGGDYYSTP